MDTMQNLDSLELQKKREQRAGRFGIVAKKRSNSRSQNSSPRQRNISRSRSNSRNKGSRTLKDHYSRHYDHRKHYQREDYKYDKKDGHYYSSRSHKYDKYNEYNRFDKYGEKYLERDVRKFNKYDNLQYDDVKNQENQILDSSQIIKKREFQKLQLDKLSIECNYFLQDDMERNKYERTKDWDKKKDIIHWGQRKLFFSEMWFLTEYGDLADIVIYSGAAPGTHICYLARLFPKFKFILVDPGEFRLREDYEEEITRIEVINDYFTDEMAEKYSKIPHLFISDIRTADSKIQGQEEVEEFVIRDNVLQTKWVNIMKPRKALLKFRCPYPDRERGKAPFTALKGLIYLQTWVSPTSTESRLIPDDDLNEIPYDQQKYEEQFYFHNHVTRKKQDFSQPVKGEGLKQNWDCSVEVLHIYRFLEKFPQFMPYPDDMFKSISQMSYDTSRQIVEKNKTRNLASQNLPPELRRHFAPKDHSKFHENNSK